MAGGHLPKRVQDELVDSLNKAESEIIESNRQLLCWQTAACLLALMAAPATLLAMLLSLIASVLDAVDGKTWRAALSVSAAFLGTSSLFAVAQWYLNRADTTLLHRPHLTTTSVISEWRENTRREALRHIILFWQTNIELLGLISAFAGTFSFIHGEAQGWQDAIQSGGLLRKALSYMLATLGSLVIMAIIALKLKQRTNIP
jgi:hypothetical protein